ncbi:MAG: S41 family peptidase [Oscillospiraceae bacterium]|nr:S41 family peptidase [Oscillospiraceae bacterium]
MKEKVPVWAAILIALCVAAAAVVAVRTVSALPSLKPPEDTKEYSASDKLNEALSVIERYYVGDWTEEQAADGAIAGVVESLGDRWSYYISAEEMQAYLNDSENKYDGIGIVIQKREEGGILIATVYGVSPAATAGVQPGSVIYAVDGTDITDYTLEEARSLIAEGIARGRVELTVTEPDGTERLFSLVPGKVEVIPVEYSMLEDGIGYIRIENFKARSGDLAIDAVEELRSQGAQALIFDVRNDPGGNLTELLKILDYLLPEGTLFISQTRGGEQMRQYSKPSCVEMPMAVLINSESYSAAEFFAAALSEYGWATLVGEKTTGKGYAQTTIGLSDGSAIHISIEEYFTPNGVSLAGVGLTPDIELPLTDEEFELLYYDLLPQEDDPQLKAAALLLTGEITP